MTKKIYVDVFVFLLLHIYRMHLSPAVRKMCPILDVLLKKTKNLNFLLNEVNLTWVQSEGVQVGLTSFSACADLGGGAVSYTHLRLPTICSV